MWLWFWRKRRHARQNARASTNHMLLTAAAAPIVQEELEYSLVVKSSMRPIYRTLKAHGRLFRPQSYLQQRLSLAVSISFSSSKLRCSWLHSCCLHHGDYILQFSNDEANVPGISIHTGVDESIFQTQNECRWDAGLHNSVEGNCRSTNARIWSLCRLIRW